MAKKFKPKYTNKNKLESIFNNKLKLTMNHFEFEHSFTNQIDDNQSLSLDEQLAKDVKFVNASTTKFQWYHGNLHTKDAEDLLQYRQKIERN